MQESQWVGLLALAGGIFSITASICDWDFFMNSRKARAWVKRIGRDKARWMYGGIGAFVACVGIFMVIVAPGSTDSSNVTQATNPPAENSANQNNPAAPRATTPEQPDKTIAYTPATPTYTPTPQPPSTPPTQQQSNADNNETSSNNPASSTTPPASTQPQNTGETKSSSPDEPLPNSQKNQSRREEIILADGVTDLLPIIDPQRDRFIGEFSKQNGHIITPPAKPASLQTPVKLPESYIVTAVVEELKTVGNGSFGMGVNVQGHGVSIVIAGTNGDTSGLQLVDNKITRSNPTYRRGPLMTSGENKIVVTVRKNRLTVAVNDEVIIDWDEPARLSYGFEARKGPTDQLRIGSWAGSYRVSQLQIEKLNN